MQQWTQEAKRNVGHEFWLPPRRFTLGGIENRLCYNWRKLYTMTPHRAIEHRRHESPRGPAMKRLIVAITGASGVIYGIRAL
ncbi:MAG TPA: hypothetical protein VNM70_17510, partial [Burkholderiales bacterium]|nr:hypothetical protein [Burkholderiales bacterium]